MTFDVIIGRSKHDIEKLGKEGTVFIAKQYVKMGQTTSLSNPVYLDVAGAHVIFLCGKRGSGKCLHGDTFIQLEDGSQVKIKELEEKENKVKILTLNKRGQIEETYFSHFYKRPVEKLLRITLKSKKEIKLTPEHPLLTKQGWKAAQTISIFETIATPKSNQVGSDIFWDEITSINLIEGNFEVYDLTVPNTHNFIANGIVVHNSYTMGSIAEGLADLPKHIKQNLSIVLLDTMGIYWTMKYPNYQDAPLLKEWGFDPKPLDVKIYTPTGFYYKYKDEGIPTDFPFSLTPIDVGPEDWLETFKVPANSAEGVLLSKVVQNANNVAQETNTSYDLDHLINLTREDQESEKVTKSVVINLFEKAKGWKIFDKNGTPLKDIVKGGQVTVLDVSPYATMPSGWEIKAMVTGLLCKRLFQERMLSRKSEEFQTVDKAMHYFSKETKEKQEEPLVWVAIDEAHELLPREGKTAASDALITILREGRQPGISLILATQQPGKIHTDVMTQSDIVLSHRLTAKMDVEALGLLMQSYMRTGLDVELNNLPRQKGAAILFDDNNERLFPIQMRPRFTWHGGSSPTAVKAKQNKATDILKQIKDLE